MHGETCPAEFLHAQWEEQNYKDEGGREETKEKGGKKQQKKLPHKFYAPVA